MPDAPEHPDEDEFGFELHWPRSAGGDDLQPEMQPEAPRPQIPAPGPSTAPPAFSNPVPPRFEPVTSDQPEPTAPEPPSFREPPPRFADDPEPRPFTPDASDPRALIREFQDQLERLVERQLGYLDDEIEVRSTKLDETINAHHAQMSSLVRNLQSWQSDLEGLVSAQTQQFERLMVTCQRELNNAVAAHIVEIQRAIAKGADEINRLADRRRQGIDAAVDDRIGEVRREVTRTLAEFERSTAAPTSPVSWERPRPRADLPALRPTLVDDSATLEGAPDPEDPAEGPTPPAEPGPSPGE